MKMNAWVLHSANDLRYEEVEVPTPRPDEVLVRVKAVGICGSDIPRVFDTGAHRHPLIPGHEFSGIVEETGERVGVFPLIPCKACPPCQNRQFELCRDYDYLGSRRDGAFAEYVTVPKENLVSLPEEVSFEVAAMLEPMSVAVHAMRRAAIRENEKVLIVGLGTIGMFLLMMLREAGVREIFTACNKDRQREVVTGYGIDDDHFIDVRREDPAERIFADVVFECVGKNEAFSSCIDAAGANGRIVVVGNPASDMSLSRNTYWKLLRNQLTLTGTWNSTFLREENDDWSYILKRLAEKRIDPTPLITQRLPLSELDMGLQIMRDKTEYYTKVMIENEE